MKTVGIITMHRVVNYGSFLQTYALQDIIEKLGFEVEIIDYRYPNEYQFERGTKRKKLSLRGWLSQTFRLTSTSKKINTFLKYQNRYLKCSRLYKGYSDIHKTPPAYDIYITGSDQVWNPLFTKGDPAFFLDFASAASRKLSYASSFSVSTIDDDYRSNYASLLSSYDAISVRESSGQSIIKNLIGKEVPCVLDPSLLKTAPEWLEFASHDTSNLPSGDYILVYMLNYAFDSEKLILDISREVSSQTSLPIVMLSAKDNKYSNIRNIVDATPSDFIHLINGAKYVITSSFHGTAFAVNFQKNLLSVIKNESTDDRQKSFLEFLNLSNCLVSSVKDINLENIGTSLATPKLNELRAYSINYLKETLL